MKPGFCPHSSIAFSSSLMEVRGKWPHSCLLALLCYGLNFRGLLCNCNNAGILFQVWLFARGEDLSQSAD